MLDVGAGTGRVTLDLAAAGSPWSQLDADARLLAALEHRAAGLPVETVVADAREFALDRRFSLVLVPMQTLQLLGGPAGRAAFLRRALDHLEPGGLLAAALADAMDCFDEEHDVPPPPDAREFGGVRYASRLLAVVEDDGRAAIHRLREVVGPGERYDAAENRRAARPGDGRRGRGGGGRARLPHRAPPVHPPDRGVPRIDRGRPPRAALAPRGAEPVRAAIVARRGQLVDHARVGHDERHEHELGDAVAGGGLEARVAQVHEHHADLAAVVGIDQAGTVDDRDAVRGRQARARRDEAGDAGRQGDRHAGRHRRPLARPQREPLGSAEVVARVARPRPGRRMRVGAQQADMELVDRGDESHGPTVAARADAEDDRSRNSQVFLRLLFTCVGRLEPMSSPNKKQTVALALTGAVALASGAYALGSESDGSAVAAGEDERPAFVHHGGPGFGLDRLADRLGVDEAKLRDALEDVRSDLPARRELHADFAEELADELGIAQAKVEAALERISERRKSQFQERHDALAEALAKRLNLDAAKVEEALETPRFFKRPGP